MYSIGNLCNEFNLSRSTILYYDSIGLLSASVRTQANYRKYSEDDKKRLGQICAYREAGVSLDQIKDLLYSENSDEINVLERRFNNINKEIKHLRLQQKIIIQMLKAKNVPDKSMLMDKESFISALKSAGLGDDELEQLHIQFEKNSPEAHQFFLEFLGIPQEEINLIREFAGSK